MKRIDLSLAAGDITNVRIEQGTLTLLMDGSRVSVTGTTTELLILSGRIKTALGDPREVFE